MNLVLSVISALANNAPHVLLQPLATNQGTEPALVWECLLRIITITPQPSFESLSQVSYCQFIALMQ